MVGRLCSSLTIADVDVDGPGLLFDLEHASCGGECRVWDCRTAAHIGAGSGSQAVGWLFEQDRVENCRHSDGVLQAVPRCASWSGLGQIWGGRSR